MYLVCFAVFLFFAKIILSMIRVNNLKFLQYFATTPEEHRYFSLLRKYHYFPLSQELQEKSQPMEEEQETE